MVGQGGSVLVGVLGVSAVLTMAAASLMLVAGNSRNEEDMAFARAACYLDAESGLMIGAAWLRNHDANSASFIRTQKGDPPVVLQSNVLYENGSSVTVTVYENPADTTKKVESRAVRGTESMQFSVDIGVDRNSPSPAQPWLTFRNWRSP